MSGRAPTHKPGTCNISGMNPETTALETVPSLEQIAQQRPEYARSTEWAAGVLRTALNSGVLVPGAKLGEQHLAGVLEVSRNTLRQAFMVLEAQNLVERIPNRGVFVLSPGNEQIKEMFTMRWAIQAAAIDVAPVGEIAEARAALTQGRQARERGSVLGMASSNQEFHRALVDAAGSARLSSAMESVLAEMRLLFFSQVTVPGFHASFIEKNARILELVEGGDREKAKKQLREYLWESRDFFAGRL